jgi:hypothetical protein
LVSSDTEVPAALARLQDGQQLSKPQS